MVELLALLGGAVLGFVASRRLRHPERAARAASVARTVGGSLGTRRGLTAPELQRACFSEMVRHVRVDRHGRSRAPSSYVLHLHPQDLETVAEGRRWFLEGLEDALVRAARDNGWRLDGRIAIETVEDQRRRPGVPSALAVDPEGPRTEAAAPPPPERPASGGATARALVLVRTDTGERIPLGADALTVGRSRDRSIQIDDSRVSRNHARIEPRQGGWAVTDEGSANGTRVGGDPLGPGRPRPLRVGDVIGIGPIELRVATAPASGGAPGTRALDDQERTRISGEVLPPRGRP